MGQHAEYSASILECYGSNCKYEYTHGGYLGNGAFGVVYRARITDRGDGFTGDNTVAVKLTQMNEETAEVRKKRTERWQRLLTLQDDHLVKYHQICVKRTLAGQTAEFIMDYYGDRDLCLLLDKLEADKTALEQADVICYAMQLAGGVHYLHSSNIIHGDLKPGNILVKRNPDKHHTLLLSDLDDFVHMRGITASVQNMTRLRGTLHFMSPEMLQKYVQMADEHIVVRRKTDIWSLGCVFVELASAGKIGRWLYDKASNNYVPFRLPENKFVKKIIGGCIPCAVNPIPHFLARCIDNCLETNQDKRAEASEVVRILQNSISISLDSAKNTARYTPNCFCTRFQDAAIVTRQTQKPEAKGQQSRSLEDPASATCQIQQPEAICQQSRGLEDPASAPRQIQTTDAKGQQSRGLEDPAAAPRQIQQPEPARQQSRGLEGLVSLLPPLEFNFSM